jgi:asparagine synthase (glutamine-hydrolysing)
MTDSIRHRGPDETSIYLDGKIGLGFQRLSIIDLAGGGQPFCDETAGLVMVCNGEIYNYKEIRRTLQAKGYKFRSNCDVEVILPMYLEYGLRFIEMLNGQFAFVLYDKKKDFLLMARDHFGICPLFYSVTKDALIFGSEIKAIIQHPAIKRDVDFTGLDQILSFPGIVSPQTAFRHVKSMKPGHYLTFTAGKLAIDEYWDLDYPDVADAYEDMPERYYIDGVEERLYESVKRRLNADVPIGVYLSGGLDSSLIAALMNKINPGERYPSFSISFPGADHKNIDEKYFQQLMADHIGSRHHEIPFGWPSISEKLTEAVYHSEMPLKETYNTCSLVLSKMVRQNSLKVVLSGEGADEIFGGYVGYRFDSVRGCDKMISGGNALTDMLESQIREQIWGDPDFFYEKNHYEFNSVKNALYSDEVNAQYDQFSCLSNLEINKDRLMNRHYFHKRSYLDLKLRLSDHLIADHCDRVTYANSVEGRYPFLDVDLIDFARKIPPALKVHKLTEKYVVKKVAEKYLPKAIYERQKFGFVAPGSPHLIRNEVAWVNDMLSHERIKRDGYFNPDTVERLRKMYGKKDFILNLPFESDLLIVVLTFNIFLDLFKMSRLN